MGGERGVGKGSRVKLKHKGKGGDCGRGGGREEGKNVWRKRKGGGESVEERKEEDTRGSRRKAKREWWTTVRSRPVARRPQ